MNKVQFEELVLQSLEHELGGVKVYEKALECVSEPSLKKEWTKYLEQTRTHVRALTEICAALGIDAAAQTPGRAVVHHMGVSLVQAMALAAAKGEPTAAELVACECVVIAETKDHLDWELLSKCADHVSGGAAKAVKEACEKVEDEEDEHLYHSKGYCRELWFKSLGLKSVVPPPEERKHVTSAIGAARAEHSVGDRR